MSRINFKELKRLLGSVIFVLIFTAILFGLSAAIIPNEIKSTEDFLDNRAIKGYRGEAKNSVDVFFVGNSDVYRSVSPLEMFEYNGFTGYVSGQPYADLALVQKTVSDMLLYQRPKVLVLEADLLFDSINKKPGKPPVFDNNFQRTVYYKDAVASALGGFSSNFYNNILNGYVESVFPILKNHSAWKDIGAEEPAASRYQSDSKGFVMNASVLPYEYGFDYMSVNSKTQTISKKNLTELEKLMKICEENNMQLVLLNVPCAKSWNYRKHNEVAKFAEENGLLYIDFNMPETAAAVGFDWMTDTFDGGTHLNLSGARKVSPYIGKLLDERFSLDDRRNNSSYSAWQTSLGKYKSACETAYL